MICKNENTIKAFIRKVSSSSFRMARKHQKCNLCFISYFFIIIIILFLMLCFSITNLKRFFPCGNRIETVRDIEKESVLLMLAVYMNCIVGNSHIYI